MDYLILDKIYYKIFDKNYQNLTHFYAKHKANNNLKLAEIDQNLEQIKNELKAENILILRQMHGNTIIDADLIYDFSKQPEGDGAITTKNKIILAIQTADCAPVLLTSSCGNIIGAAHCGWRSTKANIIAKLAIAMHNKGVKKIKAYIGPSIKQNSYEVDENFYQDFLNDNEGYSEFFIESLKKNHYMFDLPGFVIKKLQDSGVHDIKLSEDNTYLMPHKYPSYRYFIHNKIAYNHNILSCIMRV